MKARRSKPIYKITGWTAIPCPWNNGHDICCKHVCGVYFADPQSDADCIDNRVYKTSSRIIAFFVIAWYRTLYDHVETCTIEECL